jgi:uncharacterized protein
MLEEEMLTMKCWAVVGANQNPDKFGNRIYKKLKLKGYQVYAVNSRYNEIEGDPCYPSLTDLPVKPDVVNLVVAPLITKGFLREAAALGIQNIWLQPGTYDDSVTHLAQELGLTAVFACVLVATR